MATTHTVLLGGIGPDCHSVGLTILKHALTSRGYRVWFLGNQNALEDFFTSAGRAHAVFISSMDGHALSYLQTFPALMQRHRLKPPLWYVGGNLTIGSDIGVERQFMEMGFDRAFPGFVDVETVLDLLARDLAGVPAPETTPYDDVPPPFVGAAETVIHVVTDDLFDPEAFRRTRRIALRQWPTGRAARDVVSNARFLAGRRSVPAAQAAVLAGTRRMLLQPRAGVASVDAQRVLFDRLRCAGAGVLSYQVDSYTRANDYAGAAEAIRLSERYGCSTLNGFPVVNHGVGRLREIAASAGVPLQTRHSTRDPALLAEISYAGGVTAFEGGAITYNIPYYRDYPLAQSISRWQYVDRLTGIYAERFGVRLDREFFGVLTGTLIPPCLAIAVCVLESLLAARQGVQCVSLGYAEQGHRAQDIAAIRTMREIARRVLADHGFGRVQINTVFHQYMAAFPSDRDAAEQLIFNSAVTAALSSATRVLVKTPVEAMRIPTPAENEYALTLVGLGASLAAGVSADETEVARESALIRHEVDAILDRVIEDGRGSLAQGIVAAFKHGHLDVPFSPSIHNRGDVMTARDLDGAVRFAATGRLPFDRATVQYHQHRISERRRAEGLLDRRHDYRLVERDVLRLPRGEFTGWPLSGEHLSLPVLAGMNEMSSTASVPVVS
jgi:methylaspartate mutase epsilon subunit